MAEKITRQRILLGFSENVIKNDELNLYLHSLHQMVMDGSKEFEKEEMIKDLFRFLRRNSRGLVELENLRDVGVRISIGDGIDYQTYDDWNNIQVRFLLNEMPVTDASKKVKRVVESRQSDGNWICAVPYGYYFVDTKNMVFEVDEKAAQVIREIFPSITRGGAIKRLQTI